jgi:hypothetical protein
MEQRKNRLLRFDFILVYCPIVLLAALSKSCVKVKIALKLKEGELAARLANMVAREWCG